MKKIIALLMAIMLVLSLAACGGNEEETTVPVDETTAAAEETTAAEDVGTAALANGEWVNNAGKFAVALVGAELFNDEDGAKAIRVYLDFTNKEDSYTTTFSDETQDIVFIQNGEELNETNAVYGEDVAEFGNQKKNIRPGVTIRVIKEFALNAETGSVDFEFTAKRQDGATLTYTFDVTALPGAPEEAFTAKTIAAPDFNAGWPESGKVTDYYNRDAKHDVVIKNAEFVDGTRDTKLIRVYFDFTNNDTEAEDFFDACDIMVFQDGIQLEEGQANELCDTDMAFSKDVDAGATVTISNVYILTSDSPVEVEINDIWEDTGIAKQFIVE